MGLKIYIGFSNTTDYSGEYDDVTSRVIESITFQNGVSDSFETVTTDSNLVLTLDNDDKIFSPENTESPLYGLLVPFIPCSILYNDVFLFHGFVTDYQPVPFRYNSDTRAQRTVQVSISNTKFMLDRANFFPPLLRDKTAAQIISYIFENVAFPPALINDVWRVGLDRLGVSTYLANIDDILVLDDSEQVFSYTGDNLHNVQDSELKDKKLLSESVATKTAWDLLTQATINEHGFFYFDRKGRARFHDRYAFLLDKTPLLYDQDGTYEPMDYATLANAYYNKFIVEYNPRTENEDEILWTLPAPIQFTAESTKEFEIDIGDGKAAKTVYPIDVADIIATHPTFFIITSTIVGQKIRLTVTNTKTGGNRLGGVILRGITVSPVPESITYVDNSNRDYFKYDRTLEARLDLIDDYFHAREWLFFEKTARKRLDGFIRSFSYTYDLGDNLIYTFSEIGKKLLSYWSFGDSTYTNFNTNLLSRYALEEPSDVSEGLVAYWGLSESAGTTREDSIGSLNLSEVSDTEIGTATGNLSGTQAALFPVVTSYFKTSDSPSLLSIDNTKDCYISGWFYIPSGSGIGVRVDLFSLNGNASNSSYEFYINTSGKPVFNASTDGTSWNLYGTATSLSTVTYDQWNFFEVWVLASDNKARVSINRSTPHTYGTGGTVFSGTSPFRIGLGGAYSRIANVGVWQDTIPTDNQKEWLFEGRTLSQIVAANGSRDDSVASYGVDEVGVITNDDGYVLLETGKYLVSAAGGGSGEDVSDRLTNYWKLDETQVGATDLDTLGVDLDHYWTLDEEQLGSAPLSLATDLVIYWELDEASGTRYDETSSNVDLTPSTTLSTTTGVIDDAVSLGTGEYLYTAAAPAEFDRATADWSLACWVKFDTAALAQRVLGQTGTSDISWFMQIQNTGVIRLRISDDGSSLTNVADTTGVFSNNTWYFVYIYRDYASNEIGISVNGSTPDTATFSASQWESSDSFTLSDNVNGLQGAHLDLVGYWHRVLTSSEVSDLYNSGSGLDYATITGGGSSSVDRSDSAGLVTLTENGIVESGGGILNNGVVFDGDTTKYLEASSASSLQPADTDFTYSCWVNLSAKTADQTFIGKWSSANQEYRLWYDQSTDRFCWSVSDSGSNEVTVVDTQIGSPATSTDYLLVAYHNSTTNEIGLSINAGTPDTASHSAGIYTGTAKYRIGSSSDAPEAIVDEVGFWSKVLTSGEISALYNSGAGMSYSAIISAIGTPSVTRSDTHGSIDLTETGIVLSTSGFTANALSFDGSSPDYLSASNSTLLRPADNSFMFQGFIRLNTKTTSQRIFGKWAASNREYLFWYDHINDRFAWSVSDTGSNEVVVRANTFGSPSTATWYHFVVGHDATTNELVIVVNDNQDTQTHANGLYSGTALFKLSDDTDPFDGNIDELAFFDGMLTTDELFWLYNSGVGRSYLELSTPITSSNTPLPTFGNDWFLDGFFNLTSKSTTQTLVQRGISPAMGFRFWYDQSVDRFKLTISSDGSTSATLTASMFGSPSIDTWYYFQLGMSDTEQEIMLGIDNTEETQSYSSGYYDTSEQLYLGFPTDSFTGYMRDVRIWTTYFNSEQRGWLRQDGGGRTYSNILDTIGQSGTGIQTDRVSTSNLQSYVGSTAGLTGYGNGGVTRIGIDSLVTNPTTNWYIPTFPSHNDYTFTGWVKFSDNATDQVILQSGGVSGEFVFKLMWGQPADEIVLYYSTDAGVSFNNSLSIDASSISLNTWVFLAVGLSSTDKSACLVVNGMRVEESFAPDTLSASVGDLWFGAASDSVQGELSGWAYFDEYLDTELYGIMHNNGVPQTYEELASPLALQVGKLVRLAESQLASDRNYTVIGERHTLLKQTNPIKVRSTFFLQPRQMSLIFRNLRSAISGTQSLMQSSAIRKVCHVWTADRTETVKYLRTYTQKVGNPSRNLKAVLCEIAYDSVAGKYITTSILSEFSEMEYENTFVEDYVMLDSESAEGVSIEKNKLYGIQYSVDGGTDIDNYWMLPYVSDDANGFYITEHDNGTVTEYPTRGLIIEVYAR